MDSTSDDPVDAKLGTSSDRTARLALAVSIALFVVLSGRVASRMGTWHEEVSVYPSAGARIVDLGPNDRPAIVSRCLGESPGATVITRERPVFVACAPPDRVMPIMVSSYFAGYLYWPAELFRGWHHDDALKLRWFGIALGVLELFSAWTLLRHFGGNRVAAAGSLAIATSTPYVYVHALLVHYEFTPWMFLGGALLAWLPPGGAPLSRRRWLLGALSLGLALAGNVKTVFLLVPLALYARTRDVGIPRRLRSWLPAAGVLVLLPLAPLAYLVRVDPAHDFSSQVTRRASVAAHKVFSSAWIGEPLNLLRFWSDVASYGDQIQRSIISARWTWVLPALALAHCLRHAVLALRRRPHEPVSAVSGLLLGAYLAVCVLLYDQHPEANYAPLHTVFGAATGAFCAQAAGWVAERAKGARADVVALGLASIAAFGFGYNVLKRGDPAESLALQFNLPAQRSLVHQLLNDPAGDVLTTTYNLAGIVDSLSDGAIHAVQVHPYLSGCDAESSDERRSCLEQRLRRLFEMPELRRPLAIVLPSARTIVDEPFAADLAPSIEHAAQAAGLQVERRDDFLTGRGVAVLARIVVR